MLVGSALTQTTTHKPNIFQSLGSVFSTTFDSLTVSVLICLVLTDGLCSYRYMKYVGVRGYVFICEGVHVYSIGVLYNGYIYISFSGCSWRLLEKPGHKSPA